MRWFTHLISILGLHPPALTQFGLDQAIAPFGADLAKMVGDLPIRPGSRLRPLAVGSFGMDVVARQRDRAREGLRKLDLVMLAVAINVNDSPFSACGQDTALALDGMPESHDAKFRDAAAFCEQLTLP